MFGRGGPSLSLYYARIEDLAAELLNKESADCHTPGYESGTAKGIAPWRRTGKRCIGS